MSGARHLLAASSRALPGREAEYAAWYQQVHVHEVLSLPGFLAYECFRRLPAEGGEAAEFVTLYEVETDDPPALLSTLFAAVPTMRLTDAIDMRSVRFEFLRPAGAAGRREQL